MLRLAIPVLHVSRSAAGEAFYCDKVGFLREFVYRPTEAEDPCSIGLVRDDASLQQDRVRSPADRLSRFLVLCRPGRARE